MQKPPSSATQEFVLAPKDFLEAFGEKPSPYVAKKIEDYGFRCEALNQEERDQCVLKVLDSLMNKELVRAGEHRKDQWEKGWGENLNSLEENKEVKAIIPRYFDKYNIVRWKKEWVKPRSEEFEYRMLAIIQDWLFDKYLRSMDSIYEFGCGTGHNLFRMRAVNPDANLWGLDWASSSQDIIRKLNDSGVDKKMFGHRFDYFNPDNNFHLTPNSGVVTVASLEQIGSKHEAFLKYLLSEKPKLCIHIEPIAELLDPNHLLDNLSIEYFKKRNYLSGFLTKLRELETEGKLQIHMARRTTIGSFYIEGYSVVVWSPL